MTAADGIDLAVVMAPPTDTAMPNLGLASIAALLQSKGLAVDVHDLSIRLFHDVEPEDRPLWRHGNTAVWLQGEVVEHFLGRFRPQLERYVDEIIARRPRVIGVSLHLQNALVGMELVRMLRARAPRPQVLIGGGPAFAVKTIHGVHQPVLLGHPTFGQRELRAHLDRWFMLLDALVVGEGEQATLEICRRVRAGRSLEGIANVLQVFDTCEYSPSFGSAQIDDLSQLPHPTFEGFDLDSYVLPVLPIQISRGCHGSCPMCVERQIWLRLRSRSPESVFAEFEHHVRTLERTSFNAADMQLNVSAELLERLCDAIADAGLGIRWGGNAVVHEQLAGPLVDKLVRGGVGWLIFGVESGSQRIADAMGKRFTIETAEAVIERCHESGILTYINIVVGFPGETERDFEQTLAFLERNSGHIDKVNLLDPFRIIHHTDVARQPERFGISAEHVEHLDEVFACIDWSDERGSTLALREQRKARVLRTLGRFDIPGPSSPDRIRLGERVRRLAEHHSLRRIVETVLEIDPSLDAPLVDVLAELLERAPHDTRVGAARMLGMVGGAAAVDVLHRNLHQGGQVSEAVARSLGLIRDPRSVEYLADILDDERYAALPGRVQRSLAALRLQWEADRLEGSLAGPSPAGECPGTRSPTD